MIEKIKKLTVLMLSSDSAKFMDELQELGLAHVEMESFAGSHELMQIREEINNYTKTRQNLEEYKSDSPEREIQDSSGFRSAAELHEAADRALAELAAKRSHAEVLLKQISVLKPWGEFDGDLIEGLESLGVYFRFFSLSSSKFKKIDFSGKLIETISEEHGAVHFAAICGKDEDLSDLGLEEIHLPKINLEDAKQELKDTNSEINEMLPKLAALWEQKDILDRRVMELEDRMEYILAGLNLKPEVDGMVMRLNAFVSQSIEKQVTDFLEERDVYYLIEGPENPEETPIKLKNKPAAGIFEPITRMYGLPKYEELDTTPFFAPFFVLFFGVCLADVGYGLIILILSSFLNLKMKGKAFRPFTVMGMMFGFTTTLSGFLLNTVFGVEILMVPGIPDSIKQLVFFYDNGRAIPFALTLGVVQMLFGMCMQIVNKKRTESAAASFQPVGKIITFLGLLVMLINWQGPNMMLGPIEFGKMITSIPNSFALGGWVAIAGVIVILFSHNLKQKIYLRPLVGLWDLYNIIVGFLGDFLSYIRLFALGLSGALLGGAMNQIAMLVKGDSPTIVSVFFMVVVLVVGHSLNFALAALGAFVHPLRLTFVEFYNAVGFSGGGKMYTPFAKKIAINGGKK